MGTTPRNGVGSNQYATRPGGVQPTRTDTAGAAAAVNQPDGQEAFEVAVGFGQPIPTFTLRIATPEPGELERLYGPRFRDAKLCETKRMGQDPLDDDDYPLWLLVASDVDISDFKKVVEAVYQDSPEPDWLDAYGQVRLCDLWHHIPTEVWWAHGIVQVAIGYPQSDEVPVTAIEPIRVVDDSDT